MQTVSSYSRLGAHITFWMYGNPVFNHTLSGHFEKHTTAGNPMSCREHSRGRTHNTEECPPDQNKATCPRQSRAWISIYCSEGYGYAAASQATTVLTLSLCNCKKRHTNLNQLDINFNRQKPFSSFTVKKTQSLFFPFLLREG